MIHGTQRGVYRGACRYGVIIDDCPKMLALEPCKLSRGTSDAVLTNSTGARELSAEQVATLEGLMPLVREEPTPDGVTVHHESPEVFFGARYDDAEIPIVDIRDIDGVCAAARMYGGGHMTCDAAWARRRDMRRECVAHAL